MDLTVASGDDLSVRHFTVREAVSELFAISVTARIQDATVDLEAIVGKPASLKVVTGYKFAALGGERLWTGICSHAELVHGMVPQPGEKPQSTYLIQIVPKLWLTNQRRGHRTFQHKSIPDIVDIILAEWQIKPEWKVDRGKYPKLWYKVQYGESDYRFMSRLLEEAGISFTLPDNEGAGSVPVFADALHQNKPRAAPPIHYVDRPSEAAEMEYATEVRIAHVVRPGARTIRDHDFRNPGFQLYGEAPEASPPEDFYEQYDYEPGAFLTEGGKGGDTPAADDKAVARSDHAHGHERAERDLKGQRTGRQTVFFQTNTIDLWPGMVFSIDLHPHPELEQELLVREFLIEGGMGEHSEWIMKASSVFTAEVYRPDAVTPKPKAWGVQSATVVGPMGQEIHTDEFGRVRVQFPWDREGKADDDSSCWVRVSQGWSGIGYGMINIPRIGQEVLVQFLAGDPDQPIIVGRVFNAVEQVPYKLPDNKTVSGWKTNSSPGSKGYNEIKLEDKADKELIYLQAQKDLHKLVKRDWTEKIGRHHHRTIVENQHLIVEKNKEELIKIDDHLHVEGDRYQAIDKSTSLTIGVDQDEKIGNKLAVDAGKEIHLKAGTKVVIEAGSKLTIKGAGGFITIHPGGIDIVGTLVKINSGGSAVPGSGAK
ncbi:MAG: type VI secretion system tip protein VgrG, partial [Deltaproteobacteria bacterium]|nr:type VI secretion system tip protein VgrG [Deltaproteobacteria bacterium]